MGLDASAAIGKWFASALEVGHIIHGTVGGIPTSLWVSEWVTGRRAHLAPLSIPGSAVREVLWNWVEERVFSTGWRFREQSNSGLLPTWDPSLKPGYSEVIRIARRQAERDWKVESSDGDKVRSVSSLENPYGRLVKVLDFAVRKVSIGLEIPTLLPFEWDGGRLDVYVLIEYQHDFRLTLGKTSGEEVLASPIQFRGFIYE